MAPPDLIATGGIGLIYRFAANKVVTSRIWRLATDALSAYWSARSSCVNAESALT
jgi:hypothetical protein